MAQLIAPMKTLPLLLACAVSLFATAVPSSAAVGGKQLWSQKLGADAKWHQLTGLGTLLVGTDSALHSIDPETGAVMWKRADITKSNRNNAVEIHGTPYLAANNFAGMGNSKITMQVLDFITGETLWSTPQVTGQYLDTLAAPSHGLVIFVVQTYDAKDNGVYFRAYDLETGAEKWSTKFCKSGGIPLHLADNSGKFMPTSDLSGYHDPLVEGDDMYLGYLGIHCLDLNTGAIKWAAEFPPGNKGLKKTYAPLRIAGDAIYGAGGGSVFAFNRHTGQQLWKSDRISSYAGLLKARNNAIVSQLEVVGDKVFARYGGNFSNGQQVMLMDPLGIIALRASDGEALYNVDKPKEGLTNLMVLPEINTVMFADAQHLYGIDAGAASPVETFKVPIEFKRKMGGGDVAKIGLGLTGGVMGTLKAVKSANKARLDVPVAIVRQNGHIVVQGKQHLLGFDPSTKTQAWSLYYAAPSDALANFAMFAVTAAASVYGNAQVAASGSVLTSQGNQGMRNIQSSLDRYNRYTERRAARSGSRSSDSYTYILTKLEGKGKGVGLYGVNLATGSTERELPLGTKDPEYLADEDAGRIFHIKDGGVITAYQF